MRRNTLVLTAAAVGLATFVVFVRALGNGFIQGWDDDLTILTNPHIRGLQGSNLAWMFSTFRGGHFQPLSWLTIAVDYQLWGLRPAGHHLTSVLIHVANAVLFFFLLVELLKLGATAATPGRRVLSCAAGALIFALHPMRAESVAWATARRDLLSSLFYLLTLLAYLRSHEGEARRKWLAASLGLYALSLLSKSWGMTLPAVLLAIDWYRTRRLTRTLLLEKVPFVLLGLSAAIAAVFASREFGALQSLANRGVMDRILQAGFGAVFHLWKTLVPVGLSPLYPLEQHPSISDPRFVVGLVAVAGASAFFFRARQTLPARTTAWFCYLAIMFPMLGLGQSGPQAAADRYTYLACLPFAALAAGGLVRLRRYDRVAGVAAGVCLAVLSMVTMRQVASWKDPLTLWGRAVALDPGSSVVRYNLGLARYDSGDLRASIVDFDEALRLQPNVPEALNARGNAREDVGDLRGAIADFDRALELLPSFGMAYNNRGIAKLGAGDVEGAAGDFQRATEVGPGLAMAHGNWATALLRTGDLDGALRECSEAIRLDPGLPEALATCGVVKDRRGDPSGAAADLRRALDVAPAAWPHRERVSALLQRIAAKLP